MFDPIPHAEAGHRVRGEFRIRDLGRQRPVQHGLPGGRPGHPDRTIRSQGRDPVIPGKRSSPVISTKRSPPVISTKRSAWRNLPSSPEPSEPEARMVIVIDRPFHREVLLPQGILKILRRNFAQETAGGVAFMLAVAHACLGESERYGRLGSCEGHVEQAAFLFQFRFREHPAA